MKSLYETVAKVKVLEKATRPPQSSLDGDTETLQRLESSVEQLATGLQAQRTRTDTMTTLLQKIVTRGHADDAQDLRLSQEIHHNRSNISTLHQLANQLNDGLLSIQRTVNAMQAPPPHYTHPSHHRAFAFAEKVQSKYDTQ